MVSQCTNLLMLKLEAACFENSIHGMQLAMPPVVLARNPSYDKLQKSSVTHCVQTTIVPYIPRRGTWGLCSKCFDIPFPRKTCTVLQRILASKTRKSSCEGSWAECRVQGAQAIRLEPSHCPLVLHHDHQISEQRLHEDHLEDEASDNVDGFPEDRHCSGACGLRTTCGSQYHRHLV